MTYMEGFKQAMRETGQTDEQIDKTLKVMAMYMPPPDDGTIPTGHERDFILYIRAVFLRGFVEHQQDPQKYLDDTMEKLKKFSTRN